MKKLTATALALVMLLALAACGTDSGSAATDPAEGTSAAPTEAAAESAAPEIVTITSLNA